VKLLQNFSTMAMSLSTLLANMALSTPHVSCQSMMCAAPRRALTAHASRAPATQRPQHAQTACIASVGAQRAHSSSTEAVRHADSARAASRDVIWHVALAPIPSSRATLLEDAQPLTPAPSSSREQSEPPAAVEPSAEPAAAPGAATPLPHAAPAVLSPRVRAALAAAAATAGGADGFVYTAEHAELATLHPPSVAATAEELVGAQGSAAWHRARARRLTASSIAQAAGVMPRCAFSRCSLTFHT
jgi:hypothetical protein